MKLTLLESSQTIRGGALGSGEVCGYDVGGLPAGEKANVAYFNGAWRLLRWNDQWHGNWTGEYATPELALAALQQEIILPTIC